VSTAQAKVESRKAKVEKSGRQQPPGEFFLPENRGWNVEQERKLELI
jgi:hypothetical protein